MGYTRHTALAVLIITLAAPAPGSNTGNPARGPTHPTTNPAAPASQSAPGPEKFENYHQKIPETLLSFDMVAIPAGRLTVADPAKRGAMVEVEVKRFWIEKTETTWDEFDPWWLLWDLSAKEKAEEEARKVDAHLRPTKPYSAPDYGFGHANYAVISESFKAATAYCQWLSAKTGRKYRLPTEAEWEWACRAGQATAPPRLDAAALDKAAWYEANSEDRTHEVGQKAANAWGLHDMLGNVQEWCIGLDGKPVTRGGSYKDPAPRVHSGAREAESAQWNASDPQDPKGTWWLSNGPMIGFRVVREE